MMDIAADAKIEALCIWLNQNGFKKESALIKSAYAGGAYSLGGANTREEAEAWNEENLVGLDPNNPEHWPEILDAIHLILDAAGLVPGAGTIPDVANAILYTVRQMYFYAALSLVAVIPGLGIGATIIKRLGSASRTIASSAKKAEIIGELAHAASTAGVAPAAIQSAAAGVKRAFERNIDKIIAENESLTRAIRLSRQDAELVLRQIDAIVEGIEHNMSAGVSLSQEVIQSVRNAMLRVSPELLGINTEQKIRQWYPDLNENAYAKIRQEVYRLIRGIRVRYALTPEQARRFANMGDSIYGKAVASRDSMSQGIEIFLNVPVLLRAKNVPEAIKTTLHHEIVHGMDFITAMAVGSVRRDSILATSTATSRVLVEKFRASIGRGIRRTDEISQYLSSPAEIFTRLYAVKSFVRNDINKFILKLTENNMALAKELPDGISAYLASNAITPEGFLYMISVLRRDNLDLLRRIFDDLPHGDDIISVSKIFDADAILDNPRYILDLINSI